MIKSIKIRQLIIGFTSFILSFFVLHQVFTVVSAQVTPTAILLMSTASLVTQVDQNMAVGIGLNSTTQSVVGVDAVIYFDSRYLQVDSVATGSTYLKTIAPMTATGEFDLAKAIKINQADPAHSTIEVGAVAFDSVTEQPTTPVTGSFDPDTDPIVTITFKGKAAGSANLSFKYDGAGATNDSNIVTNDFSNPEDILLEPQSSLAINVILNCNTIDFNGINGIDVSDVQVVANRWGMTSTNPNWVSTYDLNSNNVIDITDIQSVAGRWGETCIPTP